MSAREPIHVGGIRWELSTDGAALLSANDLQLAHHLESGRALIIKNGEHRTVYRVQLAKIATYWKHCRLNGSRAWWRDIFRGPKAKLEFDRLADLARLGIGTVLPLAWGRFDSRWPRGSFLITQSLDDAIPLDEFLTSHPFTAGARRMMSTSLAQYIAALHAAGVSHPDFHPGNLLVRMEANEPRYFLIDVHDIRRGKPLDDHMRLANLAQLNRWFRMRASRTDRLRFWRTYAGSGWSSDDAAELERKTDRSIAELWASRDGRSLRSNRHFRHIRGLSVDGFCVRELDSSFAAKLIS